MWEAINKTQRLGINADEGARDETGISIS